MDALFVIYINNNSQLITYSQIVRSQNWRKYKVLHNYTIIFSGGKRCDFWRIVLKVKAKKDVVCGEISIPFSAELHDKKGES